MSDILAINKSVVVPGLGTYTHTIPSGQAGLHYFSAVSSENPPSGLSIVINQNGSPVYSSSSPAAAQKIVSAMGIINCAASDVITVVISSSSVIDEQANTVSTIINLRQGQ